MDLLLICRDALASSLLSNLILAMEAKKAGTQVAILFTQEALEAVAGGVFLWPRELMGQERRLTIAESAKAMGLPIMGRGEGRQVDAAALLGRAREAGVPMYACGLWTQLRMLKDKLPEGVTVMELATALETVRGAKTVVGSF